ncbi:MAG: 50S ribosomal protein L20 [Myxococcota bacterium]
MARVKRGYKARRRRNRVLQHAKGYRGGRSKLYRTARNAVFKAWTYAYRDRRQKKRTFRRLWISRINAAARMNGTRYGELTGSLRKAGVELDRKVLADIAVHDPAGFTRIVDKVRASA